MTRSATEFPVNPTFLKWARESIGLGIDEAAKKIGVKNERLQNWESGSERPSYPQIKKISNVYKRSTASFLLKNIPTEPPIPKDFRVIADSEVAQLSSDSRIAIRRARAKRLDAIQMFSLLEVDVKKFTFNASLKESPEKLAHLWRDKLAISLDEQKKFKDKYQALNAWKEAIESLDILVFQASMKSVDELRGLTIFDETLPIILLNTKDDPLPRIFSLLHEFCHILLHVSGIGNMSPNLNDDVRENKVEIFCNSFAANFLVPRNDILVEINQIKNFDLTTIQKILADKYRVSQEVICRRLFDVGVINNKEYNVAIKNLRSRKVKKSDSGPVLPDRKSVSQNGKKYVRLVFETYRAGKISIREALQYLGVKTKYLAGCEELAFRGKENAYL